MLLIGLMSGTSADGIDAALVEIEGEPGTYRWQVKAFVCVPWQAGDRAAILDVCRPNAPLQTVTALNYRLGEAFADAARIVADAAGISLADVDAIASHGQTVWHQPEPFVVGDGAAAGTLQIGEPSVIAARTGCLTIADFRAADMALGGQGAPLVPFVDWALFASPTETRAVQNIGGIANVTFLPKGGGLSDVLAFDTGPGNIVIDALMTRITQGRQTFDADGALAAQGQANRYVLDSLLQHPFFRLPPPKSTGREMFGARYTEALWQRQRTHPLTKQPLTEAELIATVTALTAKTIQSAYRQFLLPLAPIDTVIVGGGGAKNKTLLTRLRQGLAPAKVVSHEAFGLSSEAKEAVAFAILGYETLHGRPANVPSATGANAAAILGKIVFPPQGKVKWRLRLDKSLPESL